MTLLYTINKKKNVFLGSSFFYNLRKNSSRAKMSIEPLPQPVTPGGFRFRSGLAAPGKYRFHHHPGPQDAGCHLHGQIGGLCLQSQVHGLIIHDAEK